MSIVLVFSLLHLAVSGAAAAGFTNAVHAYRGGDYATAAREFAELARLHPASGTLQNLGLAEWRSGRVGPAVLAWERSLWVDPFNDAARENLRYARKTAQLEAPEPAWYEAASQWLPANAWAWLAGGGLWFAVSILMLPRVLRWRRTGGQQALAAAGLAVFLLCLPAMYGVQTRSRIGIVLERDTPLRLTPTREGQILLVLSAGQSARCERVHGDHLLIHTRLGRGWIERTAFGLVCAPQ
jgi:hypothetical protein